MDIEALAERLWLEYRWADVLVAVGLPVHTGRDGIHHPHMEPQHDQS